MYVFISSPFVVSSNSTVSPVSVGDPDIRPTDYESFMYDPEDMFSDVDESDRKVSKRHFSYLAWPCELARDTWCG